MTDLLPISIALVGAPGSGKQDVATRYADLSAEWYAEHESEPLSLIYNPGNDIAQELDQAVGIFGGWKEDLRVFFRRYEQEQALMKEEMSFLTMGTALENLAHTGVNLENIMRGIQTEQQQQELQIQQVTMTQLTYLFLSTFRYSFAFRLPRPSSSVVLPDNVTDTEDNYNRRIDDALTMVLGNFGIRMQHLTGTPEEQAAEMHEVISNYVANGLHVVEDDAEDLAVADESQRRAILPSDESVTLSE